jgi:hypothetical protein
MKQLFTMLLFVLALGAAQAYSPPQELIDEVTITITADMDHVAIVDIAQVEVQNLFVASNYLETDSNIGEIAVLPDPVICTVRDDGSNEIELNLTSLKATQFYKSIKQETNDRDYLLDDKRETVLGVPWHGLARSSINTNLI